MRAASFDLDPSFLAQILHLPPTASIFSAHSYINAHGALSIKVTADDPSLPEADRPHETTPTVTQKHYSWDWGVSFVPQSFDDDVWSGPGNA